MYIALCTVTGSAQDTDKVLTSMITIDVGAYTGSDLVDILDMQHGISLSFNGMGIDLSKQVFVSQSSMSVANAIDLIFGSYEYTVIENDVGKLLLSFKGVTPLPKFITVRGKVYDRRSGEILIGATVYEQTTNNYAFTNEYGFYSLAVPIDQNSLLFHSLGYKDLLFTNVNKSAHDVFMDFDNQLDSVLISPEVSATYVKGVGGYRLTLDSKAPSLSVGGDNDVLEKTKGLPGVQSGNEGQTGLYVRGGSPDQNLVLLDGIPLYEVSHAVGLSSIFIEESIRDISFSKNGFPARYGGRLSSVLNVTLKEGSKKQMKGSVKIGATAGTFHLEGPIAKGKTSFSVSAKKSWLNLYLDDIYTSFTEYDGIGVSFHDVTAKISHNFSPTRKLTVSYYEGQDVFGLERNEEFAYDLDRFLTSTKNEVQWGSRLLNAQYSNVIKDNFFFNISLGGSNYKFNSRSSYTFESKFDQILTRKEYDLKSLTETVDYIASVNLDYFYNEKHRFKFGASYTVHQYKPEIKQSATVVDSLPEIISTDEILIPADEYGLYFEDTYRVSEAWEAYMGVHLSGFSVGGVRYSNLQPRLKVIFEPTAQSRFDVAYTNTAQYIHLLINPGTGLPSDLWVPSTEKIAPQTANQISVGYTQLLGSQFSVKIGGYLKGMKNVLEYQSPVDLIFSVINQTPAIDTSNWSDRVAVGTSISRGLELQGQFEDKQWQVDLAYTYAKTTRTFETINDGAPFPYKYDRRHDLNTSVRFKLNDHFSAMARWVYGNGNAFSLSLTEVTSLQGAALINAGDRNNYQLPSFHHLDLQFDYSKPYDNGNSLNLSFGIYNVYSRLNGFYIYIFENPLTGDRYSRKVSVFPVMPQISLSYAF